LEQRGKTTRDDDEDPQAAVKQGYERDIERGLNGVFRDFGQKFTAWLRDHKTVKRQVEGIGQDILSAGIWGDLAQALKQLLLPSFESMMQDAAQDALAQLPYNIGIDFDEINAEAAEWAQEYVGELITGINGTTKKNVQAAVANWIESGGTLPELTAKMSEIFNAPWRAKMIAVTEVTKAFAYANEKAWMASRVITRKEWQTAMDERVCPICGPLHGTMRKLGSSFPGGIENPPAHPNCRCWIVPVVE
jgi:SPP1 gp7 family putative phage head morphogenesis protein